MSHPDVLDRADLLWVGVDLDGTLAKKNWTQANPTSRIGEPIWANVGKVNVLAEHYKIVIHTSRPWTDYERIESWLEYYDIPWDNIQCGKPLYKAYIDDRAVTADSFNWLLAVESIDG